MELFFALFFKDRKYRSTAYHNFYNQFTISDEFSPQFEAIFHVSFLIWNLEFLISMWHVDLGTT